MLVLIALLAVGQIATAWMAREQQKEFLARLTAAFGVPEQEKKNWSVLHRAIRKATAVLGRAELESVKTVADVRHYTGELEEAYKTEFRQAAMRATADYEKELAAIKQDFGQYLAVQKKAAEGMTDEALEGFVRGLLEISEKESGRVREEMENYKKMKMEKIDKNAAKVLEETAKIVLGRKLPMEEEGRLIEEALEEAKKEGFI